MVMIALSSSLIGAVLGTRYKFAILFPATFFGVALVAGVAALNGSTVPTAIGALGIWTGCLQLGYLGGLLTRCCLEATGLASDRSLHSTVERKIPRLR